MIAADLSARRRYPPYWRQTSRFAAGFQIEIDGLRVGAVVDDVAGQGDAVAVERKGRRPLKVIPLKGGAVGEIVEIVGGDGRSIG